MSLIWRLHCCPLQHFSRGIFKRAKQYISSQSSFCFPHQYTGSKNYHSILQRYISTDTTFSNVYNSNNNKNYIDLNAPENAQSYTNAGQNNTDSSSSDHKCNEINQDVTNEINQLHNTIKELQDKYLRALAESENMRIRHQKENENVRNYSISRFAEALLEVADSFDLALAHIDLSDATDVSLLNGIKLIQTTFDNILEKFNIISFNPINQPFSPTLHEALFQIESKDNEKGIIIEVVKKGYKINNRILRYSFIMLSCMMKNYEFTT